MLSENGKKVLERIETISVCYTGEVLGKYRLKELDKLNDLILDVKSCDLITDEDAEILSYIVRNKIDEYFNS